MKYHLSPFKRRVKATRCFDGSGQRVYPFYDLSNPDGSHPVSILPEQLMAIRNTNERFNPKWTPNWIILRDWGVTLNQIIIRRGLKLKVHPLLIILNIYDWSNNCSYK